MVLLATRQPFEETLAPADQAAVAREVRAAHDARRAVYPCGGRTALDYGIAPTRAGAALDLTGLARIVDYTPRDMTILVEAGVRMADLAATLATEGQQVPIDVPRPSEATIGGVVATNWNGSRRYGYGTIRDYVIGVHAVDGRGVAFKAGGRVVKNVAGYDLCKLLTGSLGTLAVITQLALKLKPRPEQAAMIVADCPDLPTADAVLRRLAELEAPPVAIDLLTGPAWRQTFEREGSGDSLGNLIVVRLEGTAPEVAWLAERAQQAIRSAGGTSVRGLAPDESATLWQRQVEFSDHGANGTDSPLVLKFAVPPSAVTDMIAEALLDDINCNVQAQAGNGIVYARFSRFDSADLTRVLVGKLRPAAVRCGGSLIVVSSRLEGLTPHMIWGGRTEAVAVSERVKEQFDPHNILNPGRFVI